MANFDNYDEVEDILGTVLGDDFIDITKYRGFDPSAIRTALETCRRNQNINPQVFSQDISRMIFTFLTRGTNLTSIGKKSTDQLKKMVSYWKTKYNLKETVKNAGANAINLSRVAAAYPVVTTTILHSYGSKIVRPVPDSELETRFSRFFPSILRSTIPLSLIPHDLSRRMRQDILKAFTGYAALETKYINKDFKNSKFSEAYMEAHQYVTAAYSSTLLNEEQKREYIRSPMFQTVFVAEGESARLAEVIYEINRAIDVMLDEDSD